MDWKDHRKASENVSTSQSCVDHQQPIKHLTYDHKLTWEVYFWYQGVLEGYALEVVVECHQYWTKVLKLFKKGLCGRLIEETSVWLKMLMVEQGMCPIPTNMEA
jgi:hypothetical protein